MVERFWSLNGDRPMVGWAQSLYRLLWLITPEKGFLNSLYESDVAQTYRIAAQQDAQGAQTIKKATLERKNFVMSQKT